MSELAAGVNSSETLWTVDAVPDPEFGFYTVGSEIVQVIAGFPGGDPGYAVGQTFPSKIRVIRATNGTTAASHLSGAALTAANAFSGGGGGSPDFTDGTTTVTGVTTVQSGIVVDQGGGSVSTGTAVISDTDPGAIGAGNLWLDSSAGTFSLYPLFVRDPTDAFWIQASLGDKLSTDPNSQPPVTRFAISDADANELSTFGIGLASGHGTALIEAFSVGGDEPKTYISLVPTQAKLGYTSGATQISVIVDPGGVILGGPVLASDPGFIMSNLPTSDPSVFGQLYTDGAPSTGVPKALMVSGG